MTPATRPVVSEVFSSLAWMVRRVDERPESLFQALKVFLGVLRQATLMEVIELFLADPKQRHLILTLHEGTHAHAFLERPWFAWGEGYPGIVAWQRQPLVTHHLAQDRRYLRQRVKELGYHSYICFPLELPWGLVGVLNLASRDPHFSEEMVMSFLEPVGPMLAAGLYTMMTQLAEAQLGRMTAALQAGDVASCTTLLLEAATTFSGARLTTLRTRAGEGYASRQASPPACSTLESCPVWHGEIRSVSGAGHPCSQAAGESARYCLPLWSGEEVVGVQSLYFDHLPNPPTQVLAPLLWLERLAGPLMQPAAPAESSAEPPAPPWLEVETFGTFRLRLAGKPLDPQSIGRRQAWTLLKILATHWGQPLSYDELIERLWPDADPKAARNRLQVAMHALRRALEPEPQRPQIILTDGETYRFDPQLPYRLDVERFESLLRRANALEDREALAPYREALQLYRGDFMAGEAYSDWCELDRSYLRQKAVQALERTAEILIREQRLQEAVEACRRLLQLDPWHEPAYAHLIRSLQALGQLTESRNTFARYRHFMQQADLPVSPKLVGLVGTID